MMPGLGRSPGEGTVWGVCNFLGSVSLQQKFEATDQCYSLWMDQWYSSMLQLHFIWKVKEITSSWCEGMPTQKTQREERPPTQFCLLFLYVFSPPPGPALCKLSQSGLFVLDLRRSFVLFTRLFPSLSFSH